MKLSVNIYTSTCCSTDATKPPCVKPFASSTDKKKGKGKGQKREKPPEFSTLGSWRCGSCGRPCKVTVSPRPPKEEKSKETDANE